MTKKSPMLVSALNRCSPGLRSSVSCSRANPRASALRVLLLAGLASSAACARVAPYERETLARRDMALASRNPDLYYGEEHAHAYREGSSGGGEAKGGGCGCN